MSQYHFGESEKRRYSVYMQGDEIKIGMFVIYSLTFIVPFWDALRGYVKIKDSAWFVHPLMCFGVTFMYGYATVLNYLRKMYL